MPQSSQATQTQPYLHRQEAQSPSSWLAGLSTALNARVCCDKVLVCRRHNAPALPLQSCTLVLPGTDNVVYPTITQLPVVHIDLQAAPPLTQESFSFQRLDFGDHS